MSYLSLTERDRDEMLATIGVESIDELFEQVPEGVRLRRELSLERALTEQELTAHLEELASRNSDASREVSDPRTATSWQHHPYRRRRRRFGGNA